MTIEDIEIRTDEGRGDEGRWIRIQMNIQLDKPLIIWGIYTPTLPTDRKKWMKTLGEEINKDKGYRIIAGDFNFVTNTKLDKKGGRTDTGTTESKEQKNGRKSLILMMYGGNKTLTQYRLHGQTE